ncbi:MAG TPA: DinB family protein [Streptosporangiaceae bacterium]|nr:DinB family protein [Streptosporangiaceae bacterium]
MDINWNEELVRQLEWHWENQLRPRLRGLTDDEYFWAPVADCWTISRRGESRAPISVGASDFTMDYAMPPPEPEPVTTIAWRLAHIIVAVFGMRNASHFGGPAVDYTSFSYAGSAETALSQLDDAYAAWIKGVRGLGANGLGQPCGPAEGPYAGYSMAALVLHIHREVIHHGAEIALLRDLYLRAAR